MSKKKADVYQHLLPKKASSSPELPTTAWTPNRDGFKQGRGVTKPAAGCRKIRISSKESVSENSGSSSSSNVKPFEAGSDYERVAEFLVLTVPQLPPIHGKCP